MRHALLNTTHQADTRVGRAHELPVLVDLNWLGSVQTSHNGGIVPSRTGSFRLPAASSDEVIL